MKSFQKSEPNKFENAMVKRSSRYGPNVLDWLRSVYFSLMGSTLLTLSLKANGISLWALLLMFVAFTCFSLGLICSLRIANRFKKYEKAYDAMPATSRAEMMDDAYYAKEELGRHSLLVGKNKTSWILRDHVVIYCIWIFALIAVVGAGFKIEWDSAQSSRKNALRLEKLNGEITELKRSLTIIKDQQAEIVVLKDSLKLLKKSLISKDAEIIKLDGVIKKARRNKACKL